MNYKGAYKKARNAIETLYSDRAAVFSYEVMEDARTGISEPAKRILYENIPCRLSFSSSPSNGASQSADTVSQTIKLFVAPEFEISAGAAIEITRNGVTKAYKRSGEAALYPTHQEISLEIAKEYA